MSLILETQYAAAILELSFNGEIKLIFFSNNFK